jgi:hypothetical protein
MRNKSALFTVLLALALLSVACAAQDVTDVPAGSTAMPTTDSTTGVGDPSTTPTVAADSSTPAQGAGGTAVIPQTGGGNVGAPDDLDELIRVLRTAGATVELGDEVTQDFLSVSGQIIRINGEEVQIFIYNSAELLETQASQIPDDGNAENEPHFYKLGNMLVRYVGRDPGVRDLLEDVLGARAADR